MDLEGGSREFIEGGIELWEVNENEGFFGFVVVVCGCVFILFIV